MRIYWALVATVIATLMVVSCGRVSVPSVLSPIDGPMGIPSDQYVAMLGKKCVALAEAEVRRMNQAELVYKNNVEIYVNEGHPFQGDAGVYLKWYRDFKGYRIVDIMRSDSFLNPVIYEIEFAFDFMRTPSHSTLDADPFRDIDPARLASEENEFVNAGRFFLIRRYTVNAAGDYSGDLPEIGPRNFFPYPGSEPVVQGWSPRDGRSAAASQTPTPTPPVVVPAPPMGGAGFGGM